MAVSLEQWAPAAESIQAYYPSVDMGPGYGAAYDLPVTSEYSAQQLSVFGDTIGQTYVRRILHSFAALSASYSCACSLPATSRAALCRSAREQIPV